MGRKANWRALACLLFSWAMLYLGDPLITAGYGGLGTIANLMAMIGGIFIFPFAVVMPSVNKERVGVFAAYFVVNMILIPLPMWMNWLPLRLSWL